MKKDETGVDERARAERIALLAVVGDDSEFERIEHLLDHCNWAALRARSCQEAMNWLEHFEAPVVLCGARMPDGCWKDLLRRTKQLPNPPRVILMCEIDMPLWAEFVNLGGFDILAKPLERPEFVQVISGAWQDWREQAATSNEGVARAPGTAQVGV
jgi:DNA-binding NtrC family response regulator